MTSVLHEQQAGAAFSKQSAIFDEIYSGNTIVHYKRKHVREHFLSRLQPDSHILELNSGTGEDAIYFAQQGHSIHATDISEGMQQRLKQKAASLISNAQISTELCSFTRLDNLQSRGPYDAIFSNFGGLNCTDELDKVLASFNDLLKPGGIATMVIIPKFCLWESLLIFKGKFRTATRRWFAGKGRTAHIEGQYFTCWYYNPSYLVKRMKKDYDLVGLEGLCTFVPPSYIEGFAEKHPKNYRLLQKLENRFKSSFPFKYWGDYFIISFRKR
ncbi:class I SAM-dependent methyltransferase [Mucilaginibacter agri]|uniref:Methyltransferase domain-containing protein n=1 Tax=Mucilaginibacter agri TaxID=2695265 RepID=A0A965ZG46_9SPHI|nr:class I SAM-dependent methyltransferase [Mucilaginibacter agri]NCD69051.1 methyltransferase domain-containing protein [Mucilaginibacter agri]